MKKINKGVIYGFVFGFIAFVGITYASQSITNINQTAVTGDRITAAWVNDVNSKLRALNSGNNGANCGAYTINPNNSCRFSVSSGFDKELKVYSENDGHTRIVLQCVNGSWSVIQNSCNPSRNQK